MKNENKIDSTIPFQGFYNSAFEYAIDCEIEQSVEYHQQENGLSDKDAETLRDGFLSKNNGQFLKDICLNYAERFIFEVEKETGLKLKAKFLDLESPREYNFTTDRIFIELPESNALSFIEYVIANHKDELEKLIKQRFTSGPGFISFYDNTLEAWGDPTDWDCNQIGTCFEVFASIQDFYIGDSLYEVITNSIGDTLSDEASAIIDKLYAPA